MNERLILASREMKAPISGQSRGFMFYLLTNPSVHKSLQGPTISVASSTVVEQGTSLKRLLTHVPEGAVVVSESEYLSHVTV